MAATPTDTHPVQPIVHGWQGAAVHRRDPVTWPDRRRPGLHEAMRGAAAALHGHTPGAADHLLHARPGAGRAAAGSAARRRGHRAVVHVRVDGQRLRPARREAGIRRHPPGHVEPGRDSSSSASITRRTRAIVPVHYAGVGCEMDAILDDRGRARACGRRGQRARTVRPLPRAAARHVRPPRDPELPRDEELHVRRRAARCSINDARYVDRAEILREKGTNRSRFFRGQVDKYSWVDVGSSYVRVRCPRGVPVRPARDNASRFRRAAVRSGSTTRSTCGTGRRRTTCACRSCRRTASRHITCSISCCPSLESRQALIAAPSRTRHPGRLPLPAAAPLHDGPQASEDGPAIAR